MLGNNKQANKTSKLHILIWTA